MNDVCVCYDVYFEIDILSANWMCIIEIDTSATIVIIPINKYWYYLYQQYNERSLRDNDIISHKKNYFHLFGK